MPGNQGSPTSAELLSLRTHPTKGGARFEEHSHPFWEFSLATDDTCSILLPAGARRTRPNTLLHYHPGEVHGALCSARQKTRFWVVHFRADGSLYPKLDNLVAKELSDRIWALTSDQVDTFQWIFMQMLNERSTQNSHSLVAESSWLELLLVNVQRWADQDAQARGSITPVPAHANPDVMRLWHLVNEAVGTPNDQLKTVFSVANYDSTRHAFKKTFGCSPRKMLLRLRMEHAKNLLLDSPLSIKEIAVRIGYSRQHEFNRMFHQYAGMAPSHWRTDPEAR